MNNNSIIYRTLIVFTEVSCRLLETARNSQCIKRNAYQK